MPQIELRRRYYSKAERLSDAAIHVVGLTLALMAVPVLVTLSLVWRGDLTAVVGTLIYGATLIAMLLCSALYHMVPAKDWKVFLRRLDHSAIYFKIAGTYTPFTLLTGGHAMGLLATLWVAAVAGSVLKVLHPERFKWVALGLYLAMGWAGVLAGWPMFTQLSGLTLGLIVIGGLIYTMGVGFFLAEMLPFHNTIWHGFVLIASVVFYCAVLAELAAVPELI